MLLGKNIPQTPIGRNKEVIRKSCASGNQYLAYTETSQGRKYFHTFARRSDGAASWKTIANVCILIINCIITDRSAQ